uniref:DDE Tnp4 domain-containing protein n=1 Tax=Oryza brachyantha TaxID=4533 RepID=J3MQR2_ORYBR
MNHLKGHWHKITKSGGPGPMKNTPDRNMTTESIVRPVRIKRAKKGKGTADEDVRLDSTKKEHFTTEIRNVRLDSTKKFYYLRPKKTSFLSPHVCVTKTLFLRMEEVRASNTDIARLECIVDDGHQLLKGYSTNQTFVSPHGVGRPITLPPQAASPLVHPSQPPGAATASSSGHHDEDSNNLMEHDKNFDHHNEASWAAGIHGAAAANRTPATGDLVRRRGQLGDQMEWTDAHVTLACELMAEQVSRGNRPNTHLNTVGYTEVSDRFYQMTGILLSKTQIKTSGINSSRLDHMAKVEEEANGNITNEEVDHWNPMSDNPIVPINHEQPIDVDSEYGDRKKAKSSIALLIHEAILKISDCTSSFTAKKQEGVTIKEVMEHVLDCGAEYGSDEHDIATQLFVKKDYREMFMTLPTREIRLNWLRKRHNDKYVVGANVAAAYVDLYCCAKNRPRISLLCGMGWLIETLNTPGECQSQLRISTKIFYDLHDMLVGRYGLKPSTYIFLFVCAGNESNRKTQNRFKHSGETIHRKFYEDLIVLMEMSKDIRPKDPNFPTVHNRIRNEDRAYPHFKDCIGALDGTHVRVSLSPDDQARYIGKSGKYYVVDAEYPNRPGYLCPYKGEKYRMSEWHRGMELNTPKEKFNRMHSSICNVIVRSFGLLKIKWQILFRMSSYPMFKQKMIVVASMVLRNFIHEHGGEDLDFARCDHDPNYIPTIP